MDTERSGTAEAGKGGRRPTIRDVAAAAGVSTATVSHALNAKGRVDPATRARVFEVASELGYRPSRIGRALRTQRTGSLAFLVAPFESAPAQAQMLGLDVFMRQAFSAAQAAFAADHALLLVPRLDDPREVDQLGVDGAIICDPFAGDFQVASFESAGLPVVTIERPPDRPDYPWTVAADNARSFTELLDHLAAQGARSIALVSFEADIGWDVENRTAYRAWCERGGREPRIGRARLDALVESGYEAACSLLDAADPPDAIIASAQGFPSGVMRAINERGLRTPSDVMVASAVDGLEAQSAVPALTAIDVRPELQGRLAAEMLIARVGGQQPRGRITTPHELRVRASTARAR
ncbi:LacI family DNA-binding transcriptional regulator [Thermoleophilia bacterium SCSIO 60948]|nr:LacI family DNA-binding transcriptional regulator [Thermoleophilia bacterium SCSIO 60948]